MNINAKKWIIMTVFILTMSSIDAEGKKYGIYWKEYYSDINRTKEEKHKWTQNFLYNYGINVINITETDLLTEILGDGDFITSFKIKVFHVNNWVLTIFKGMATAYLKK